MSKIEEIFNFLKTDLEKIDQIIIDFSYGKSPLIKEISNHLILSGGKRIRPILLILASKLCDKDANNYHNLAAAVELIHSATLLHDDVVDNSQMRRNKETANSIWDNKASILVGDFVFSLAFQLMVKNNNMKVLDLLSKTSSIMADGEVLQLENSNKIDISINQYSDIIFGKTAALFSAACEAPGHNHNIEESKIISLRHFGKNLGLTFQIIDDILDYIIDDQNLGKSTGDDFFEGKVTIPIILAYNDAIKEDKERIRELFEHNLFHQDKNPKNLEEILRIIKKYNSIEKSYDIANKYYESAIKSLSVFEDSIYKDYLKEILKHSLTRKK